MSFSNYASDLFSAMLDFYWILLALPRPLAAGTDTTKLEREDVDRFALENAHLIRHHHPDNQPFLPFILQNRSE
jgi:hypothetical protein